MTVEQDQDRAERLRQAIAARRGGLPRASTIPPRPEDRPRRLGPLQRGLWFVHQLDPRSPAYNLASAFRVEGRLDAAALERAARAVAARHLLLRSTFQRDGDGARQVVHEDVRFALERIAADTGQGLDTAAREAARPFDLERGPLLRLILVEERADAAPLVLLVLHHILADERSLGLLWNQIAAAYAQDDGRAAEVPGVQYDDYVHWSRQEAQERRGADLAFWRARLDPVPDALGLPFGREATASGTPSGDAGALIGGAPDSVRRASIRTLAASLGVTPFTVCAFAFRLLLQRYSGGSAAGFGTPVSLRTHPATADMVGYFLNPIVVNGRVDESVTVGSAIGEFARELAAIMEHATVPIDVLTASLRPARGVDRNPLFQVMFVYQEAPSAPEFPGCRFEPVTLDLGASKFDLTLFATERAEGLEIAIEFRTGRYEREWMSQLVGHYEQLLDGLAALPGRPVADVPLVGRDEADRLSRWSQGPPLAVADPPLVTASFLEQARARPASLAVVCAGGRQDYRALEAAASDVASQLSAAGVQAGDRVGIFLDRSPALVGAVVGTLLAGAAYVPLDPSYPEARNRDVLDDAEVRAVVTAAHLAGSLPRGGWRVLDVADRPASPPAAPELNLAAPSGTAYLLYTSGSTGRPKGVVVSHDNLRRSTQARLQFYERPPGRFLLIPGVAFDSSVAGLFWTLATGGTLIVPTDAEARDARALARLIAEEQVTSLLCVPSLYGQLLAQGGSRLGGLEQVIVAGESCPPALVARHRELLPDVRLFNEYGPTEATVWATASALDEQDADGPVRIGRPIAGVRVDVLDDLARPVPPGVPGSGWIAGPTVAAGYWRRDELTAERFRDPVAGVSNARRYRTGDTLAWTRHGDLLFLGRDDEQIKLRGFRIEPGEIEAALIAECGVDRAAVVLRTAAAAAPQLVGFVTTGGRPLTGRWREALAGRIPAHMIPARVIALPALPLLPNGKIDRAALRALPLADDREAAGRDVPGTREQALVALWEGLLGRSGIGLDDNFFELGGHSLLVVLMAAAIERDFEVSLPAADVFGAPTVRSLARRIASAGPAAHPYDHLFPIQPDGDKAPLVMAVPDFFTQALSARFRPDRPVYGVRGVSLRAEGNRGRWKTMTDVAREVAGELDRRFPGRPCILAGYSFGSWLAFETARVLEARGAEVRGLYLIAPMPLDFVRLGPFRWRIDGLQRPLAELTPARIAAHWLRSNHPLTNGPYRRARQWLTERPWRRLLGLAGALRRRAGLPVAVRLLEADVRAERFRLHAGYRPAPVRTPTVFFNPVGPATDSAATWRPFFAGPLTVHPIPDPHDEASVEAARDRVMALLGDLGDR